MTTKLEPWMALPDEQINARSPQLDGLEGSRVEVVTLAGETRRFWVSRNHQDARMQIHLELPQSHSRYGNPATETYRSVRVIRHCRHCTRPYSCGRADRGLR